MSVSGSPADPAEQPPTTKQDALAALAECRYLWQKLDEEIDKRCAAEARLAAAEAQVARVRALAEEACTPPPRGFALLPGSVSTDHIFAALDAAAAVPATDLTEGDGLKSDGQTETDATRDQAETGASPDERTFALRQPAVPDTETENR